MEKREYPLSNGHLVIVENNGCYAVIYNNTGTKCYCLTTDCEFDFKGNDAPEGGLICNINHKALREAMNTHYGLEGYRRTIISFRELLGAFAPELKHKDYMGRPYSISELQSIEPYITRTFKSLIGSRKKTSGNIKEDEDTLRMMEKFIKVELIRLITGIEKNMAKNDDDLYDPCLWLNPVFIRGG